MSRNQKRAISGYAFVRCVLDSYPDNAGDALLKAAGGCERDWLELKDENSKNLPANYLTQ